MRLYDYAASGNCYKARLLLALLGREYERVAVDIFAGDTLTDEFAKLNSAREVPVLELDDGELLTQSNAILWYLAEGTEFLPQGPLQRGRIVQWLFFEQERVMSGIGSARFRIATGRNPDLVPARLELGRTALEMLEAHLERRSFLVGGSCTIADVATFAYTHVAEDAGYDLTGYPAVAAWLERVSQLPGFMDDLVPYPENARPGASRSIYDD
ncbi:MAG TPA: glutathione S-transferase family protein [Gaiellaceae bacterium]|nr:glutathione S-transferase family protein [Gaiellaceae bacterium]